MKEYITVKTVIPIPNIDKQNALMSLITFILTHIVGYNRFHFINNKGFII
jgi:hypothetical protein